jgi:hypothetical protein
MPSVQFTNCAVASRLAGLGSDTKLHNKLEAKR